MWKFESEQKRFEIGNVKVGGIPGEHPTVLIGSMFYDGQKLLKNEKTGDFNRKTAENLIMRQLEISDITGNPCMLDIVGSTSQALMKFLDFAAGVTDIPLLMDGISAGVRVATLDYVKESGLTSRIIYNSITPKFKQEELEKIQDVGIKSAILLAYTTTEFTARGREKAIEGLLPIVQDAGIQNPLIDTCVLDIPTLGMACKLINVLKNEFGFPVGCGAHNAVDTWRGIKTKMGKKAVKPAIAATNLLVVAAGADFVLYGPIENAAYVFPVIAMANAAYGNTLMEEGKKLSKAHPIFKIA